MKTAVVVIFCLFLATSAQESYIPNARHPDEPNKCYLKQTGDFAEFGEALTPVGVCNKFTCRDDFVFRVNHCSRYMLPDNCEVIPTDLTKPYPECCVKLRCTRPDGEVVISNTAS